MCCVKIQNNCCEPFETRQKLRQGDVLSTLLSNVVLDVIVRRANLQTTGDMIYTQKKNHVKFTKIVNFHKILLKFTKIRMDFQLTNFFGEFYMIFSLSVGIVGRTQSAAQDAYLALEIEAAKVGLKINEQKTK
jgi:hypothetical protein